ncbi:MAG: Rrf2 family transcriptional regulator [Phycisphaerales bacterium]|nr:MAG: Rrf2 family transcriptional regulator [Phycisphaerales bacterium]
MDLVRRNTDYAVRLMVHLAKQYGQGPVSTRVAADEEGVSYPLACKLMQKLHGSKLIDSCMGPKGGFSLGRAPAEITLLEVVEAIQGPISINRCLLSSDACNRQPDCPVRAKLAGVQENILSSLASITFADLCSSKNGSKPQSGEF